jgi:hypothetical protein
MAVKPKPVRGRKTPAKPSNNILVQRTEIVPIGDVKPFYKNPRVGNIDKIAKSLEEFGQFRPIMVNIGTHTGRPNEVGAGNHTLLAARRLGMTSVLASFIDVDEETLKKIVLTDNRLAEDGTYDYDILAELLKDMDGFEVTGFDQSEVDKLLAANAALMEDMSADITTRQEQHEQEEREERRKNTFMGSELGDEDDDMEDDIDGGEYEGVGSNTPKSELGIEDAPDTLKGIMQFKPPQDMDFEGVGYWGITKLLNEQLMTFDDLPKTLSAWAGSATRDDADPDRWWLYNWGIDSTSGMQQPKSQVIVSFYAFDDYFERWWWTPEKYMAKVINSGIKKMITPNWSQSSDLPRIESLWNLYRSRWVGRYAQECGLQVAPDVTWRDGDIDYLEKYVLATLPKGIPLISLQLQTIDPDKVEGGMDHFKKQVATIFKTLKPQAVLLYTGPQGQQIADEVFPKSVEVMALETRMSKLAEAAKHREKKHTI